MLTPHYYQAEAIEHLWQLYRAGLPAAVNGSDMGTGKTLEAIEIMRRFNAPTLAVVPKATIPSWHRHAAEQGTEISAINWEMVRTGRTPYGGWNGDKFEWNPAIKFLIFDEVHRAMGRDTKNSAMVRAARDQRIRALAMSATLADNPLEMDATGYLLRLHDGLRPKPTLRNMDPLSFSQWTAKHGCGLVDGEWAFRGTAAQRARHMANINALLYPSRGVRVKIEDLGDAFPDQQLTAELYEIDQPGRIDVLYQKMAVAIAALHERASHDIGGPQTDLLRARQEVELLKVPVFVELTEEAKAAGRSVIIFINFRQTREALCERLKTDCFIDGTQAGDAGAKRREANRLRFQSNQAREIICNGEAGGVGLDLDDITGDFPRTFLRSPGYNAKTERQLTGRPRRASSKSKSLGRFIFAAGTCEEGIQRAIARKLDQQQALNDGDLFPQNLVISSKW